MYILLLSNIFTYNVNKRSISDLKLREGNIFVALVFVSYNRKEHT